MKEIEHYISTQQSSLLEYVYVGETKSDLSYRAIRFCKKCQVFVLCPQRYNLHIFTDIYGFKNAFKEPYHWKHVTYTNTYTWIDSHQPNSAI